MVDRGLIVTIILDSDHSGGMIEPNILSSDNYNYVLLAASSPLEFAFGVSPSGGGGGINLLVVRYPSSAKSRHYL